MDARTRCSVACVVETDRRRSEKNGNAGMYVTHVRAYISADITLHNLTVLLEWRHVRAVGNVIHAMWVTYVMHVCRVMHAL